MQEDNWVEKTQAWEGWQAGGSCILVSVSEQQGVELWEKWGSFPGCGYIADSILTPRASRPAGRKGTKVAMATWQPQANINIQNIWRLQSFKNNSNTSNGSSSNNHHNNLCAPLWRALGAYIIF